MFINMKLITKVKEKFKMRTLKLFLRFWSSMNRNRILV